MAQPPWARDPLALVYALVVYALRLLLKLRVQRLPTLYPSPHAICKLEEVRVYVPQACSDFLCQLQVA